ncbi:DUF5677 domain-containing protein [Bacillus atrophaeus]|uniref:DUF5677 domain-containing protein n=1 Tax=Bacillus atrophaeus TaxID=1452 RepID=UPI002281E3B0|nr:DUF5677 domain-containing protein [Bacillus atrophaeus]MCY8921143.1 hypothetical protein [Bacillus atrophaeus]MCY9166298.1 hypothetical protein [Bacillus atrophaeus]
MTDRDLEFEEMLRKRTNPNIKDFKFDKKKSLFINPVVPEAKSSAGELYIYSLTVGHLWIIEEVKSLGFGDFIKDLILFAKRNKSDLLEWNISQSEEIELNQLLSKYNTTFERKIVSGMNIMKYKEELELLKEKNHPYHTLSRIFHMVKSNLLPEDILEYSNKLEDELEEKSSIINAIYLGFKAAGAVEEEVILPKSVIDILKEFSPCMVEKKELKYYAKVGVENNYFERLPKLFSMNWDWLADNEKVIISKLLYSFKIIKELNYSLFAINGVLAAASTRILFDNYWQSKYLIENNEIQQYKEFALDRMRLHILKRTGKEDVEDIGILMLASNNDLLDPIPIHGDYFKKSARDYAIQLNLKDDYDKYYEYNSEFIHASLTAILSSLMVECANPEHLNHLTVSPSSSRYIDAIPHIFDIINAHISLVNDYLGEEILENVKLEDYFFKERESFLLYMESMQNEAE